MLFTMGIILGVVSLHHVLFENPEFNKSCRDIGFNNFKEIETLKFCEDEEGNLYPIKLECSGIFSNYKCKAKIIKITSERIK
jgi:hypothetical protein